MRLLLKNWVLNCKTGIMKKIIYILFGLFLFVAIPLPGTGGWTGALIASVLKMRLKDSLPPIIAGVLVAGFVMTLLSYGVLGSLFGWGG